MILKGIRAVVHLVENLLQTLGAAEVQQKKYEK
jgi:hypothetical protein